MSFDVALSQIGEHKYRLFLNNLNIKKTIQTPRTDTLVEFGKLSGEKLIVAMMREYLQSIGALKHAYVF